MVMTLSETTFSDRLPAVQCSAPLGSTVTTFVCLWLTPIIVDHYGHAQRPLKFREIGFRVVMDIVWGNILLFRVLIELRAHAHAPRELTLTFQRAPRYFNLLGIISEAQGRSSIEAFRIFSPGRDLRVPVF